MKATYQSDKIHEALSQINLSHYFSHIPGSLHIIEYEPGEAISSAFSSRNLLQILISGTASIFCVRDDGNIYSLAQCHAPYIMGEFELFYEQNPHVHTTALTACTCAAVSTEADGHELLNDPVFLRMIAKDLVGKLRVITNLDGMSGSLRERVVNYMTYYCKDQTLSGVEKTAFQLHCSPRQLQRILNDLVKEEKIRKTGKGTYVLKALG